jgi:hypothetical protein
MRRLLFSMLGALAVVGLLATPVSAAGPVENEWGTITGTAFDVTAVDEAFVAANLESLIDEYRASLRLEEALRSVTTATATAEPSPAVTPTVAEA